MEKLFKVYPFYAFRFEVIIPMFILVVIEIKNKLQTLIKMTMKVEENHGKSLALFTESKPYFSFIASRVFSSFSSFFVSTSTVGISNKDNC